MFLGQGAPHVILNMCYNKDEIKSQVDAKVHRQHRPLDMVVCVVRVLSDGGQVHELGTRGIRSLAIARQDNEDGRWRFLGIMTFLDPPRPDTKHTIEQANLFGVEVSAALFTPVRLYGILLWGFQSP
jgi:H+-transporting ATPase